MSDYIVGIDIGSSKICTVIGTIKEDNGDSYLEIIGTGSASSHGIRKGSIINISKTVDDINQSVKEAEITAGLEIESAYINISGKNIKSIPGKGSITITNRNKEINEEDVERVVTHGSNVQLPPNNVKLHILTQEFMIDEQDGIQNPVGMIGNNLEVDLNIITVPITLKINLINCLNRSRIRVDNIVLSHIASGEAVLTEDEKQLGVALIDIGEGVTDVGIFEKGVLVFSTTIPIGGFNFTNDLAIGIRTPIDKAERIKRKYGLGLSSQLQNQTIDVPNIGAKKNRQISVSLLEEILRPRAEEIFEYTLNELTNSGYKDLITAGIVLTGGGSMLEGIVDVANDIFTDPIRIGEPYGVGGLINKVGTPEFATAVGLLKYGYMDKKDKGILYKNSGNFLGKIKNWFGL